MARADRRAWPGALGLRHVNELEQCVIVHSPLLSTWHHTYRLTSSVAGKPFRLLRHDNVSGTLGVLAQTAGYGIILYATAWASDFRIWSHVGTYAGCL